MDLGLAGRVALVAASSKGLGRAVADTLAAEGADLILCARTPATLEATAETIRRESGRRVVAVPADLGTADGIARVVETGRAALGPIDILVTNSGGPPAGRFDDLTDEHWSAAIDQLLHGVRRSIAQVLPDMRARGWGRILNVTSISVKQPVANLLLSNSVRAAVTGLARTLADEVAADGITVNNILPGYTRTERVEELAATIAAGRRITADEALRAWEREIPLGRLGRPDEFAAVAAFLVSERASYVTGVSVPVDGGWTRSLF